MAPTALIDTHVLIWLAAGSGPASSRRDDVAGGRLRLVVSAVSAFEISLKVRLGKLDAARPLLAQWQRAMSELQAQPLPVTAQHGIAAGSLAWGHGDPFDRLLVAQARVEGLPLVTADRMVLGAPGVDVLAW